MLLLFLPILNYKMYYYIPKDYSQYGIYQTFHFIISIFISFSSEDITNAIMYSLPNFLFKSFRMTLCSSPVISVGNDTLTICLGLNNLQIILSFVLLFTTRTFTGDFNITHREIFYYNWGFYFWFNINYFIWTLNC